MCHPWGRDRQACQEDSAGIPCLNWRPSPTQCPSYTRPRLLALWCALRFGEPTELRRREVVLTTTAENDDGAVHTGVIHVERAVVRLGEGYQVTTPNSEAGMRDVAIPPHVVPAIRSHLATYVGPEADALLFPAKHGGHLAPGHHVSAVRTPHAPRRDGLTYGSTTYATAARCWPQPRVPRWPN